MGGRFMPFNRASYRSGRVPSARWCIASLARFWHLDTRERHLVSGRDWRNEGPRAHGYDRSLPNTVAGTPTIEVLLHVIRAESPLAGLV